MDNQPGNDRLSLTLNQLRKLLDERDNATLANLLSTLDKGTETRRRLAFKV